MTLSEYICDLLYRYNCVIVPEFGAFLTQRVPATISKEVQLFYPPQKRISFNKQIVTNDGLLANYIAKKENLSYENANLKIQQYVQEIQHELETRARVSFSEIGFFAINFEQKLVFEPLHTTNYLTESFGLTPLRINEVNRINDVIPINNNVLPINTATEDTAIPKRSFALKYAAVGILLLGISGIGVNSYKKNTVSQTVQVEKEINERLDNASFVFEIKEVFPTINIEAKKTESTFSYHIIAGAFRGYKNATKKLRQLQQKGFNATYIGKNKYGLHQITYNSFSDENDAINSLNKLKRTENPAAWLLIEKR